MREDLECLYKACQTAITDGGLFTDTESFQATSSRATGHQTLKSSALCPTSSKLTCQYMVLNNLMVHYKKLERAKSCVDNSPPKAWLARKKAAGNPSRSSTLKSTSRQDTFSEVNYDDDFEPSGTSGRRRSLTATERDYDDAATTTRPDNDFEHSGRVRGEKASAKLREEHEHYTRTGVDLPKYDDNDLITRHSDFFSSEVKPFTPRKLQNNRHTSRLSTMPCYCPPRRSRSNARSTTAGSELSSTVPGRSGTGRNASRPGTAAGLSDTLADDMMRSIDGRFDKSMPTGVPPLNISLDADHIRWLQEHQSAKSTKSEGVVAAQTAGNQTRMTSTRTNQTGMTGDVSQNDKMNDSVKTMKQRLEDEEANKYQDFMAQVIRDILERGIFTNRGLRQVFESHVDKRNDLRPGKMREILTELEQKLGLPPDHVTQSNDYGYASTLRPSSGVEEGQGRADRQDFKVDSSPRHVIRPTGQSPVRSGRPPLPKPGRRDSSGSGGLLLEDFAGVSPPTPRRNQPAVRRESPDVLTIDGERDVHNGKNYHVTAKYDHVTGKNYHVTTASMTSVNVDDYDDDTLSGFDEVDNNQRGRQRQKMIETISFGARPTSISQDHADDSVVVEIDDKSGRRTKRKRFQNDSALTPTHPRTLPPSTTNRADKSGRRTSPRQQQRANDDVIEEGTSSTGGSAASLRGTDKRRQRQRHVETSSRSDVAVATSVSKAVRSEVQPSTSDQLTSVTVNDPDDEVIASSRLTTLHANDDDEEVGEDIVGDGFESDATNEELLDTMTMYRNRLEKTNYVDERGCDSDNDSDHTVTASRRSPPVPTPRRAAGGRTKAETDDQLSGGNSYSSVEVSDLDENEISKMR